MRLLRHDLAFVSHFLKKNWQLGPHGGYQPCPNYSSRDILKKKLLGSPASTRSQGRVFSINDHACEDWSLYLPGTTCGKAVAAVVTAAQRACAQARFAHWYATGSAYDGCPPSVLRNLPRPYLTLSCFDPDFEKLVESIQELRSNDEDAGVGLQAQHT